jgi:hypothetical protein
MQFTTTTMLKDLRSSQRLLLLPASCCFLAWLILQPWIWRKYVPPKYQITSTGVHGVISEDCNLSCLDIVSVLKSMWWDRRDVWRSLLIWKISTNIWSKNLQRSDHLECLCVSWTVLLSQWNVRNLFAVSQESLSLMWGEVVPVLS